MADAGREDLDVVGELLFVVLGLLEVLLGRGEVTFQIIDLSKLLLNLRIFFLKRFNLLQRIMIFGLQAFYLLCVHYLHIILKFNLYSIFLHDFVNLQFLVI